MSIYKKKQFTVELLCDSVITLYVAPLDGLSAYNCWIYYSGKYRRQYKSHMRYFMKKSEGVEDFILKIVLVHFDCSKVLIKSIIYSCKKSSQHLNKHRNGY